MNQPIRQLDLLLRLRERDGERLEAELAAKRRLQERYRRNVERLDQLSAASGPSAAAGHPALALNCAGYKSHLLGLRQSQQPTPKSAARACRMRAGGKSRSSCCARKSCWNGGPSKGGRSRSAPTRPPARPG